MKILAIETSCDETAVAVLDISGPLESPDIKILGNALYSQAHLHEEYGGVYPSLAKREHQKNLPILLEKVLTEAGSPPLSLPVPVRRAGLPRRGVEGEVDNIDFIAVTRGPGLEPALWTGITFAEELGAKWGKPVVPVNHMEGHIWSVLYREPPISKSEFLISKQIPNPNDKKPKLELPALALLISGGHTELVLIKNFGEYEILGRTRDDAVGEAFDKTARMLGLSYPGGPQISKLAEIKRGKRRAVDREFPDADREQATALRFPRPMIHSENLDFSFSGLKTAVLYKLRSLEVWKPRRKVGVPTEASGLEGLKGKIAKEFENAVTEVLVEKSRKALDSVPGVKAFIVAGGVAANKHIIKNLRELADRYPDIEFLTPDKELSTDNAVMIGIAGYVRATIDPNILKGTQEIVAEGNLSLDSTY